MIDIHSHVLPGFDDGPRSFEDSVLLTKQVAFEGTSVLFATPHVATPVDFEHSFRIPQAVKSLQTAINELGIQTTILPGAEVFPSFALLDNLDKGCSITLGEKDTHILLDMPLSVMPVELDTLVFELKTRGITPILAHPERSMPIQKNPQLLEKSVHMGLLIQINASSLMGDNGNSAMSTTNILLDLHWAHFVASDAHSLRHRPSRMAAARRLLVNMMGADLVEELFVRNGQRIVRGEAIPVNPQPYARKQVGGFMGRFLSLFSSRKSNF